MLGLAFEFALRHKMFVFKVDSPFCVFVLDFHSKDAPLSGADKKQGDIIWEDSTVKSTPSSTPGRGFRKDIYLLCVSQAKLAGGERIVSFDKAAI